MTDVIDVLLKYFIQVSILFTLCCIIGYIKIKTDKEKFDKYLNLAKLFVFSVEQEFGAGKGQDKKAQVSRLLKDYSNGKLSDTLIDMLIEAAVFHMNSRYKLKGR